MAHIYSQNDSICLQYKLIKSILQSEAYLFLREACWGNIWMPFSWNSSILWKRRFFQLQLLVWVQMHIYTKQLYSLVKFIGSCYLLFKVFLLTPSLKVSRGDSVKVSFSMIRSKENHRLMDMEFTYELHEFSGQQHPATTTKIFLE
jgi:hypothetical protein